MTVLLEYVTALLEYLSFCYKAFISPKVMGLSPPPENDGSHASQFTLSAEGEAFLEATFDSCLQYKDRRNQIVKYGEPDSR